MECGTESADVGPGQCQASWVVQVRLCGPGYETVAVPGYSMASSLLRQVGMPGGPPSESVLACIGCVLQVDVVENTTVLQLKETLAQTMQRSRSKDQVLWPRLYNPETGEELRALSKFRKGELPFVAWRNDPKAASAASFMESMRTVRRWTMGQCFCKELGREIPVEFWDNQDFVESCLSLAPWSLNFSSERLKDCRDLIEKATKIEPRTMCLASQRLKHALQCEGRYLGGWGDY
eukprot:TRINITY_DN92180_c0_g1_i1.p1 TRINITY_DN92180_c0_g1~~TRINITY_DN92180_c0_g1_i1.p1  ORF type:complete len:235 (-),score=33.56 TRINITY_DN92180_c0_g1_i1:366-1070(-)